MEVKRWVGLLYVIGAVIAFVIFDKFLLWIWPFVQEGINSLMLDMGLASGQVLRNYAIIGTFVRFTTILSLAATALLTYYLYAPEAYRSFVSEVVIELKKVTWPDWNETRRNTLIVIAFTVILAGFLGIMDWVWKFVTDWVLTPEM